VFRGNFGREAAEQVTGATLSILSALTDKSLLHRTDAGRYDLHELVRQYSAFKLNGAHEESAARQRHFDYYLSLAETVAPHLTTAERGPWFDRLEAEHDNLRTALGWSQVQIGNSEPMVRLAGALYWFWFHRGDLSEGRNWLESALARADDSVAPFTRARALYGAGSMAHMQGDNALAGLCWRRAWRSGEPAAAQANMV
jgi:non-specific serine/threonine protein kinase